MRIRGHKESGVAMIEVLIAIIVISFGLLGVAGLQLAGIKSSQTSNLRSIATAQAYDMADRMRNNMTAVQSKLYDDVKSPIPAIPTCANPFSATVGCSNSDMAKYDIYAWLTANAQLLPGGSGTVKMVDASVFDIEVQWSEKCVAKKKGDASVPGESLCGASDSTTPGTLTRTFSTRVAL